MDRSFSAVVLAFDVPRELPLAMLDGFRWDIEQVLPLHQILTRNFLPVRCRKPRSSSRGLRPVDSQPSRACCARRMNRVILRPR